MSSFDASLDSEVGLTEDLTTDHRAISIAEFFEKNKHMLGFDSEARALVTAIKEGVDNALDASEEAGILPDIYVSVQEVDELYRIVIEDNGPGITKAQIPKVFGKMLYGSRFHVREQARGQQGLGISAAVLYAQLTSGKPAKITSRTPGATEAQYFELVINTDENEPEIREERATTWDRPHGTRIEIELAANMRARRQLHDYIKQTAVVNPHARIELHEPGADLKYERATEELPPETEEIRPHPHGVELGTVLKMLSATDSHSVSGFLREEFTRVGRKSADEIIDGFRDRLYGREMSWALPAATDPIEEAIVEATQNKGQQATEAFATEILSQLAEQDRLTYTDLEDAVAAAGESAGETYDRTFGATVREHATEAAWTALTADVQDELVGILEEATSDRKEAEILSRMADRLAPLFEEGSSRHRLTRSALREAVDRVSDMTVDREDVAIGETARENITEALWDLMRTVDDAVPKVRALADDRDGANELVAAMREVSIMAPPTDCLAPISAELVEAGLRKEYEADFFTATTRDGKVHAGDPFVVEAGIAYGGSLEQEGSMDVMRFANRVPLVYQRGACATTNVVKGIGWRNYGLEQPGGSGIPMGPVVLLVHVASTNVPFTSESKDAIANVPEIEDEIELAVRECARDLRSYLNKRRSLEQRREKADVLATILPRMASKVAAVTGRDPPDIDDALARIMNNVLVDIAREDGGRSLRVRNHSDRAESFEVTAVFESEPTVSENGLAPVDMDGEWYLIWEVEVEAGEETTLEYVLDADTPPELLVDGIDEELVTVTS